MERKHKILSYDDRKKIEEMSRMEVRVTRIAKELGVDRTTIYYEYKRSGTTQKTYTAEAGQKALKRGQKQIEV